MMTIRSSTLAITVWSPSSRICRLDIESHQPPFQSSLQMQKSSSWHAVTARRRTTAARYVLMHLSSSLLFLINPPSNAKRRPGRTITSSSETLAKMRIVGGGFVEKKKTRISFAFSSAVRMANYLNQSGTKSSDCLPTESLRWP